MGPVRAEWGRAGPVRAEWGWGRWACIGIQLNYFKTRLATRIGQVGPRGPSGAVGPVRAEWGWGGVGHALGVCLGPGYKDRPRGWGRVGEGLGMHWDSITLLQDYVESSGVEWG